jgi:hypothetical protein
MSWDIVIFNAKDKIESIENLDQKRLEAIDFCSIFEQHFTIATKDNNYREIVGKDFSITYHCDEKPVDHKLTSVNGESGIFELAELAKKYNWQLFDTALGEMIELNNPARNGYKYFKSFQQQVLNKE